MPSARIYQFPRSWRRRPGPPTPASYVIRPQSECRAGGFALLLVATLILALLYFSEAVSVERHDALYAGLLAAVWCLYFAHEPLLRTRVLGRLLVVAGRAMLAGTVAAFFGGIYWLILSHG